jgi:DNA-binding protein Fis
MYDITLISTAHTEIGKCNSEGLLYIIEELRPEVIFLEALKESYTDYEEFLFSNFGVYHNRLEISAIQKYKLKNSITYVPVLENGLPDSFTQKYNLVCQNQEVKNNIDNLNKLIFDYGFQFLNSEECIRVHESMRILECQILNNNEIENNLKTGIDEYENTMIDKIYSYCNQNQFNSAVFMCGSAHRKAIIEKIKKYNTNGEVIPNWIIYQHKQ